MKLEAMRVISGPNYWSIKRHNLILMRLDLEEIEELPTNKIPGFAQRMIALLPSLYEHRCSEGKRGGFLQRVQEGTWMGHVIEHIALEIQTLAGMDTGFGRTRSAGERGVYHVVFSYIDAHAGKYAGKAAINIADALIKDQHYNLATDIKALKGLLEQGRFGPSTGALVNEARKRNIPVIKLNNSSLVQLGYGINQRRIEAAVASTTSNIAVELAGDKHATKDLLEASFIPVPDGKVVEDENQLHGAIERLGYPLAIKPLNGNQGRGATINVGNWNDALTAFEVAKKVSASVICEKYIAGYDFRVLLVNYAFVAAARRKPALVTGDGIRTIQELVDEVNRDERRGEGHNNVLTKISINEKTLKLLRDNGLTLGSVLPPGQECFLTTTANLSTGGTATDVTDFVHPANIALFQRAARITGLDICGIDVIAPSLATPILENGGAIIEINASPGLRMHLHPSEGTPRNVAEPIIDMMYPAGARATIPIVAVTGTNGKTTTTRLIAHICREQQLVTGFTTTEGIYIQNDMIVEGDCSGPASAQLVLKDPAVEVAVLECARGGILRSGLGFSHCDVAVITNVAEDHLGMGGIDTLEKMARVKAVVAESVYPDGCVVLNADDDLVYEMHENVDGRIALFSLDANNPRIKAHCRAGGVAAVFDGTRIILIKGEEALPVEQVENIPLTFNGRAEFNIANVLGAVLAAHALRFDIERIRCSLRSFVPSPALTPGRMNLFTFYDFHVMIDYAHNPHGLQALGKFIRSVDACKRLGIIAGVGDRRDGDIIHMGKVAAAIFDEIIVRMDDNTRGRSQDEIYRLITDGVRQINGELKMRMIPDEAEAITTALTAATPNSFVVVLTDRINEAIAITNTYHEQVKRTGINASPAPEAENLSILRKEAI